MVKKISCMLKESTVETPMGPMRVIADEKALYLLEFVDCVDLEHEVERVGRKRGAAIVPGRTEPMNSIESELGRYFEGKLKSFKTPLFMAGSPFQERVWQELMKIPYGETRSYAEIAIGIGRPSAFRAVAQANASNQLAILIPCHRVINSNGALGGYNTGVERKKWFLIHEGAIQG